MGAGVSCIYWSALLGEYIVVPPEPTKAYGWFPVYPRPARQA